ncbi:MAG: gliding motility-associated C-terminal domain-containing protein [Bacteroidales bacterium]|nr:gliding motility-associated C-terminal domain-containing protein [Bacteroidales bacterium]HNS30212.1 gliding motility-associated C-terminal domain-containing protein [Tenuifilaceae bacterium]
MRVVRKLFLLITVLGALVSEKEVQAQLFSPGCDWVGTTQYQYVASELQDPIFIFFSWSDNPMLGNLRAQFSDSTHATYLWRKYDPAQRQFNIIQGQTDSLLINLDRGGYRAEVTVGDSTEIYTAWVMIDDVEIDRLAVWNNNCERLTLALFSKPNNFYEVNSNYFTYYNYYTPIHAPLTVLGPRGYFGDYAFASNPDEVPVDELLPFLQNSHLIDIEFESPANQSLHGPLHDAKYELVIHTPFGKGDLQVETEEIPAIATRADFELFINQPVDGIPDWVPGGDSPSGEALLEIKLESSSENADSIYWKLHKITELYPHTSKVIWSDSSYMESGREVFPPKELMVPGFYKVEHSSKKLSSGCIDKLLLPFDENKFLEVDSSFFKGAAIPNVFTPNGANPTFKFVLPEDNIMSIKDFKITIFSRWGNRVYAYTGDPKTWEGWDGKIDGTKGDAAAGVYYFVIEAVGWDGKRYRKGQYKGFLHLFR